jgi:hypothetical protein
MNEMDEAFIGLHTLVEALLDFDEQLVDENAGVRSAITAYEIETPIELDISRATNGAVRIGSTPPLYRVDTSIRPSFHTVRFRAELDDVANG